MKRRDFAQNFWFALAIGATATVCAEVRHEADIRFLETPQRVLHLDLFVPEVDIPPPLVVFIHRGSWLGGNHKNSPFRWLADEGIALASISYRFSSETIFPAQIHDCKAAIRWLRAHAADYGYDPERIAVIGESAGATLALLLGVTTGVSELEGELGDHLGQSTAVRAIISYYGASDFILRARTQPQATNPPDSVVHRLLGTAPADNETQARLASPAHHVSETSAPLLVFHGTADKTVLFDQSERIADAYRENRVDVKLVPVEGGTHDGRTIRSDDTNATALGFLRQHLAK